MLTQLLSAAVFSVALLVTSFSSADKTAADCCQANPACCVEGTACCAASIKTDCCQADQACCGEGTACCAASIKTDCCAAAKSCCSEDSPCCEGCPECCPMNMGSCPTDK